MAVAGKKRRYALRKAKSSSTRTRSGSARRSRNGRTESLPDWKDLTKANQRDADRGRSGSFLESVSTSRFALLIVGIAVLFTLYVGHVHATQDLLAEVQDARRDNLRLHLKHNRLKGDFDRMVGPSVIYSRARTLGLVEEPAFGPVIKLD